VSRRGGLGRGLGALIPVSDGAGAGGSGSAGSGGSEVGSSSEPGPASDGVGVRFQQIHVGAIQPNPSQPRWDFDADAHEELKTSILDVGVLQPVVVRETLPGRYELVIGERRWRACRDLGLDMVPAIVRDTADDAMLRTALLENLHRQQLNPLEEAAAYQQLLTELGGTHDELAARVGKSRSQVTNTIRLLNLPSAVQRRVAAGVLTAGHARALLGLPDPARQHRMAERIAAEGLSVRAVEELVAVGDAAAPSRTPRPPRAPAPELGEIARRLSDRFDTRVRVEMGRARGRITVEFGSADDLGRILTLLAPEDPAARPPEPA
jgi:ParB family chromosome partitioning protein